MVFWTKFIYYLIVPATDRVHACAQMIVVFGRHTEVQK